MKFLFIPLFLLSVLSAVAQVKSVRIAPWRHNAQGAYSIIHDDYCVPMTHGIRNYADTMAFNRNIPFAFGVVSKHCTYQDWAYAKKMIKRGHEPINHTHQHRSADSLTWWPDCYVLQPQDYEEEYLQCHQLMKKNLGEEPTFFIYPYDIHTDTSNAYIQSIGYQGARAGHYNRVNPYDFASPMELDFFMVNGELTIEQMDSVADLTASSGGFAIQSMHGVNDGSWNTLWLKDYRKYLDSLQAKQERGELWVATPSEVLAYHKTRKAVSLTKVEANGETTISFLLDAQQLGENEPVSMTLLLEVENAEAVEIRQKRKKLSTVVVAPNLVMVEVEPTRELVVSAER